MRDDVVIYLGVFFSFCLTDSLAMVWLYGRMGRLGSYRYAIPAPASLIWRFGFHGRTAISMGLLRLLLAIGSALDLFMRYGDMSLMAGWDFLFRLLYAGTGYEVAFFCWNVVCAITLLDCCVVGRAFSLLRRVWPACLLACMMVAFLLGLCECGIMLRVG